MTARRIYVLYPHGDSFSMQTADYCGTEFTVAATSVRQAYAVAHKDVWINPTDAHPVGIVAVYRRAQGTTLWCGCTGHHVEGIQPSHGAGIRALRAAIDNRHCPPRPRPAAGPHRGDSMTVDPEGLTAMTHEAIGHFHDPTLPMRVIDAKNAWTQRQLARADELDDKSAEREAAAAEMAQHQREIQERADRVEELANATKIDLSALELVDPPEFPEADLDYANMPEPLIDSEGDFPFQVQMLHEAKHFRR